MCVCVCVCACVRVCVPVTFSTLAYLLMSISFLSPDSMVTVCTAFRAISQARSDLEGEGGREGGRGEGGREGGREGGGGEGGRRGEVDER